MAIEVEEENQKTARLSGCVCSPSKSIIGCAAVTTWKIPRGGIIGPCGEN
jgi:hypothetical protein